MDHKKYAFCYFKQAMYLGRAFGVKAEKTIVGDGQDEISEIGSLFFPSHRGVVSRDRNIVRVNFRGF